MGVETAAVINSINHAMTLGKGLLALRDSYNSAEAKIQIAELMTTLANIQIEMIDKDKELRTLKEQLKIQGEMDFQTPFYFRHHDGKKSGPYCACCYDDQKKLVNLINYMKDWWECKVCENKFEENPLVEKEPMGFHTGSRDFDLDPQW